MYKIAKTSNTIYYANYSIWNLPDIELLRLMVFDGTSWGCDKRTASCKQINEMVGFTNILCQTKISAEENSKD